MPQLRFSINQRTSNEIAEAAKNKIAEAVVSRARKNFSRIKAPLAEKIDQAIEDNAEYFTPTDQEAFQLGIGKDGAIDEDKRANGWRNFLISSRSGVTKINVRRGEGKTGIGNIAITIDYLKLFQMPESIAETPDSKKIDIIPWMEWFIDGKEITEYSFLPTPKSKVSRTGGGIMVEGGLWDFIPNSAAVNKLQISISNAVNAFITQFVAEEFSK